jgi:uncharacterized membrane protein YuzA (DUF378 family)
MIVRHTVSMPPLTRLASFICGICVICAFSFGFRAKKRAKREASSDGVIELATTEAVNAPLFERQTDVLAVLFGQWRVAARRYADRSPWS